VRTASVRVSWWDSEQREDEKAEFEAAEASSSDDKTTGSQTFIETDAPSKLSIIWKMITLEKNQAWDVPWDWKMIIVIMVIWLVCFMNVGKQLVPFVANFSGFFGAKLQWTLWMVSDIANNLVTMAVLRFCLNKFWPLSKDWFPWRVRGWWPLLVIAACSLFPIVQSVSAFNQDMLSPLLPEMPSINVAMAELIGLKDPVAFFFYTLPQVLCTPFWEEVLFRGFLLPSLSRYLPMWAAVAVSSVTFALAHFRLENFLPLTLLGAVMGYVFVSTRNLLASMVLHSLWNIFTLYFMIFR